MLTLRAHLTGHRRLCPPRAPGEEGEKGTRGTRHGARVYVEGALAGHPRFADVGAAVVRQRDADAKNRVEFWRKPHLPHHWLTLLSISNPLNLLYQVREVRKVR